MTADLFQGWGAQLFWGTMVTLKVAFLSLLAGLTIGLLVALAKLSPSRILRAAGDLYTTCIRGTPELLIILLVYFGSTVALSAALRWVGGPDASFEMPALGAGVLALSLVFGGYAAEIFRGAFLAIPAGQIEAARAFGMGPLTLFIYIRLPLMWRYALPALGNIWISLIKNTSLISIVGLEELMRVSYIATSVTRSPFHFYVLAAVIYLTLTIANSLIIEWLETRANRGVRRV